MKAVEFLSFIFENPEALMSVLEADLNAYQQETLRTANLKGAGIAQVCNFAMGIAGEAGEVVDYVKKVAFQGKPLDVEKLKEELGDVLWYTAALAAKFDIKLDAIAMQNIEKLKKRYPEGFSVERSENRDE